MDWSQIYNATEGTDVLRIIFNKGFVTGWVAIASLAGVLYLLKFEKHEAQENITLYSYAITIAGIIVLYTVNFLELQYQLFEHGFDYATQNIIIGSYNMLFMAGVLLVAGKLSVPAELKAFFPALGVVAMLSYMFFYQNQIISVRNDYINGMDTSTGYIFHYVLLILLLLVVALSLTRVQKLSEFNKKTHNLYSWFYVFFFVFMASAELDHIVVVSAFSSGDSIQHILNQNHKIGYPILWGVTSFSLIALGLKKKIRHLRIISLTLFLVTLVKLFLIDIKGISEGGKIAAFISLGLLLLVVSFMYQRLKKILLADSAAADTVQNNNES
jgi:hypothetical protein